MPPPSTFTLIIPTPEENAMSETLNNSASDEVHARAGDLRRQVERRMRFAKERMQDVEDAIARNARAGAHAADTFVHENPWRTLGAGVTIGVLAGLVIGALLTRHRVD
jgi:ElaB/YqjD/DUF883 family membrane-anchored ribosome-binding protein